MRSYHAFLAYNVQSSEYESDLCSNEHYLSSFTGSFGTNIMTSSQLPC